MHYRSSSSTLVTLLASVAFLNTGAAQDLITLRNGNQLTGRIASQKESTLELLVPAGRVKLETGSIREIDQSRPFERYLTYGWSLLKKSDFPQAEIVYSEGLEKHGADAARRDALLAGLLEAGRGFLKARRYEDGRRTIGRLLEVAPDHQKGLEERATAESMCRKIRRELSGFQHLIEKQPRNDFARYHLGLRYESLGQTDKAREEYQEILRHYPVDLDQFQGEVHRLRGFISRHLVVKEVTLTPTPRTGEPPESSEKRQRLRTARTAIFHWSPKVARDLARIADEAIRKLEKEFEIPADERAYLVFVHRTREEYNETTGAEGTTGYSEGARKIHLYQTEPALLDAIFPHELVHATLYRRYTGLPSWLDEGLAVRYEGGHGLYYDRVKSWLAEGKVLPFDELLKKKAARLSAEDRKLFYGQAYTLVDFLYQEHGGREKMVQFLLAVSGGGEAEAGLKKVYGFSSVNELEALWRKYLEL